MGDKPKSNLGSFSSVNQPVKRRRLTCPFAAGWIDSSCSEDRCPLWSVMYACCNLALLDRMVR